MATFKHISPVMSTRFKLFMSFKAILVKESGLVSREMMRHEITREKQKMVLVTSTMI